MSRNDPQYASQDTLFADLGRDLLEHAFHGFNVAILAYGQTGSGKSCARRWRLVDADRRQTR